MLSIIGSQKKNIRLIHPGQVGTVLSKKECDNTSYQ